MCFRDSQVIYFWYLAGINWHVSIGFEWRSWYMNIIKLHIDVVSTRFQRHVLNCRRTIPIPLALILSFLGTLSIR